MPLLNWAMHKQIMVNILKDIYQDEYLGSILGFKGGTAAMLFYQLPRKSVDLDFDLLDCEREEFVMEKILNIAKKYGTIKEKHIKRYTIFILLSYGDDDANIKIEINRRGKQGNYDIEEYLGISLLVMTKEDMFANKLIALIDRRHTVSRDIYDIWFFMDQRWEINRNIIKDKTGESFEDYCGEAADFVQKFNSKKLLAGLGELVNNKQKDWIKKSLLKDVEFGLRFLGQKNEH